MRYLIFPTALLLMLSGCASGDMRDKLGLRKSVPDEFNVVSNPPLYIPPEFSMPNLSTHDLDITAAYEESQNSISIKKDEARFLQWLFDDAEATNLKKAIDYEQQANRADLKKKGIIRKAVAKLNDLDHDKYVDPVREKARIKENLEHKKPINEGDVPVKTSSTLEKLLK